MSAAPRNAIRLLTAAVVLALTSSCWPFAAGTNEAAASQPAKPKDPSDMPSTAERIRVRTQKPTRDAIASYLETTSHVEAIAEADVYPKVAGVVREIRVEEGDRVKEGDVLAVLDQTEAQIAVKQAEVALQEAVRAVSEANLNFDESSAKLVQAKADAKQAKRDYEREAKLGESQDDTGLRIIAPKEVESSKLAWERAENNSSVSEFAVRRAELAKGAAETGREKADWGLRLAKVRFDDTMIKATVSGVISSRMIKSGDTATTATKLFHVTDLDHLRTNFFRPQRDLRLLGDGARRDVIATSEAVLDPATGEPRSFSGCVDRVSPVVDPQNGSFKVTVTLQNEEGRLRPGLLVRVRVTLGKRDQAFLVPKRARVLEGEKPFVFVVRDGKTARVPIVEGYSDDNRIEVRNVGDGGLREDDDVIVVANVDLKEGLSVTLEGAPASAPNRTTPER